MKRSNLPPELSKIVYFTLCTVFDGGFDTVTVGFTTVTVGFATKFLL
jgi:hypothetical protein